MSKAELYYPNRQEKARLLAKCHPEGKKSKSLTVTQPPAIEPQRDPTPQDPVHQAEHNIILPPQLEAESQLQVEQEDDHGLDKDEATAEKVLNLLSFYRQSATEAWSLSSGRGKIATGTWKKTLHTFIDELLLDRVWLLVHPVVHFKRCEMTDFPNPAFLGGQGQIHNIKLVLLGDMAVGKTSIALRFARGTFENNYKQTIGASFVKRVMEYNDYVINFQIWDTAGQERYMALVPMYLRGAQVALIIYDVTDKDSFNSIEKWLLALNTYSEDTYIVLVANKCDLDIVVPLKEAKQFAEERNLHFIQTSAKTGLNVDKLFNDIGLEIVERIKQRERERITKRRSSVVPSDIILAAEQQENRRLQCCHRNV